MPSFRLVALVPTVALISFLLPLQASQPTAEIPNASFEDGGDHPAQWEVQGDVTLDGKEKLEGQRSLHLRRDPVNLPSTQAISQKFKIAPGVWEFSGAVKDDLYSPDLSFNVSVGLQFFDQAGHLVKERKLVTVSNSGPWSRFKERLDVPSGATDAVVAVVFNKTHGDFWLDGLSLHYVGESVPMEGGDRKAVFHSNRDGFLFYPGDDVWFGLDFDTPVTLAPDKLGFRWEVTDFYGELQAKPQQGQLVPDGKAANGWNHYHAFLDLHELPLKTGPYYELHTTVDLGAAAPAREWASFAILPAAATLSHDPLEVPFGAHTWNTTVYEFYPLAARLGLRRCLAFWSWSSKPPYAPPFTSGDAYNTRIGYAKKFGMLPWGVLYPVTNIEHHEGDDYSDEALREGIRHSIETYSKDGLWGFQIGNEPPAWNPDMVKRDVATYKVVYEAIKKTDPHIFAIGSAIGPNEAFFKAGFQPYQDAYNIHAYNDLGELRKEMREYHELFKKYGGEKPIWSTEIGSNSQGLTRDVIAKDLIRKAVCFFADGGGFFSWFAVGGMPDPTGERSLGSSDSMDVFESKYDMYMARLDAIAYYNIVNSILVKKFVQETDYPNGVNGFLFRDKKAESLLVFWGTKDDGDFHLPLPGVHEVKVTHYDGRSILLDAQGKGINLRITRDPVLLTFQGGPETLPAELAPASVSLAQIPDELVQGKTSALTVLVAKGVSPLPELTGPPLWTLSPSATASDADGSTLLTYQVTVPADSTARQATFQLAAKAGAASGDTELLFGIPVKSRIELKLVPVASDKAGTAAVQLVLTNNSNQEQTVNWKAELLKEAPMENGTYDLMNARPPTAFFTGDSHDKTTLKPQETKAIALTLTNVDRLTIYRIRGTAADANGNPVQQERFIGGFAQVPHAKGKITLDGVLNEPDWQSAPKFDINELRQVFYSAVGAKKWAGLQDLSGTVRFLWDDHYLYVGIEVTDDIFRNTEQDARLWEGDGLQFLINPYRQSGQGKGRYDFSMGHGLKGDQVWCHLSADPSAPTGEVPEIRMVSKRLDPKNGNVVYEIAFPWSRLAPFKPAPGNDLGLSVILNEDDGTGRKSFMGWFGGVHLKETDLVGDLILGQ